MDRKEERVNKMSLVKRILNWKRDLPDWRDKRYKDHRLLMAPTPLPSVVDLRPQCSPMEDQGQVGDCTAYAWAGMLEFLELQALNNKIASPEILTPTYTPFSHLFLYYNERLIDGDVGQDAGSQLRTGAQALATYGDCAESTWPADPTKVFIKPSDAAYAEANNHKISVYSRLESPEDYKSCLAEGFPFVFGASLYESFESSAVAATGIVPMPSFNEGVIGGHAILCVGYDETKQVYIVRNSWGPGWGDKGYCYFQAQYLENPDLCSDMWTARK
jgi:C1A family cysteine protease